MKQKTVLIGMSGGVDSSVAAALLVKSGYHVVGGFIKNWSDTKDIWSGECEWRGDRRDALRVAAKLNIPLLTFDFEDQYRTQVIDPMFEAYKLGKTPNPDVLCNQVIKFGLFVTEARRLKLDFIATGHYARVKRRRKQSHLYRGLDPDKDQSYFLHRVKQEALTQTIFPVGELKKSEVRKIARSLGLATAEKKESMGICFIGKQDMKGFLRTRISSKPGNVVDPNGLVVGSHDGFDGVTIGQRHGFKAEGGPWYAAAKDADTHCLIVVPDRNHELLYSSKVRIKDIHWIVSPPSQHARGLSCAVRFRQESVPIRFDAAKKEIQFQTPVFAVAPGQSAVMYQGDECLGGGIIV